MVPGTALVTRVTNNFASDLEYLPNLVSHVDHCVWLSVPHSNPWVHSPIEITPHFPPLYHIMNKLCCISYSTPNLHQFYMLFRQTTYVCFCYFVTCSDFGDFCTSVSSSENTRNPPSKLNSYHICMYLGINMSNLKEKATYWWRYQQILWVQ